MGEAATSDGKGPKATGRWQNTERNVFLVLPFVAALLFGLWSHHRADSYYGALDAAGVDTQATILSKRIISRTTSRPGSAYEVTVSFGAGDILRRGSVQVTKGFHDRHDPPDRVPIRYLPDDPQVRSIDPAMRGRSTRRTITIIGILLFIGVANLFIVDRSRGGDLRKTKEPGK